MVLIVALFLNPVFHYCVVSESRFFWTPFFLKAAQVKLQTWEQLAKCYKDCLAYVTRLEETNFTRDCSAILQRADDERHENILQHGPNRIFYRFAFCIAVMGQGSLDMTPRILKNIQAYRRISVFDFLSLLF